MEQRDQHIYEELLADSRFVLWASGRNEADRFYWEQWQKRHPDSRDPFYEACRTVQMLKFKSPAISLQEVSDRWLRSKRNMKLRPASGPVFWFSRAAAVLLLPLLVLTLWFYFSQRQIKAAYSQLSEYSQKKAIRVTAPLGAQLEVELPDGTRAWLNSGSEISYPASFTQGKREVEMTGEVYFQVSKSQDVFIVKNPGPTINVYGTAFNVHAYPDEKEITVALAEGTIALEKDGKELVMNPGEVVFFDASTGRLTRQETAVYPYTCWREGKYIFRDAPLGSILKTLERRYHVTIQLDDSDLSQFKYNATIKGEPLEQILELMTFSAPISYEYRRQQLQPDGSYTQAKVRLWRDTAKMMNPKK